jgi:hypothetical protein
MGFDVNFSNKPIIKESQSAQDGGAGNLGYFEQGEKEKEKEKNSSIFSKEEPDSFKKHSDNENHSDEFSISKLIAEIIMAIKDWFKKIFG